MINIINITFHETDAKTMQGFRHGVYLHSDLPFVVSSANFAVEYKDHFIEMYPGRSNMLYSMYGICKSEHWENVIGILKSLPLKRPECFAFHVVSWDPSEKETPERRFKSDLVGFEQLNNILDWVIKGD